MFKFLNTSIGKKQVVATTGLFLILFVVGHLAGNLLIFLGPESYNAYADKLAQLRPALYLIETSLFIIFLIHIVITVLLVLENIRARGGHYALYVQDRSLATRLMPYTGTYILIYIIWHLLDFTFTEQSGPKSILADGKNYGLYGLVYNTFSDPWHSWLYVLAMAAIGFHLSHGIQSFFQTYGFICPQTNSFIRKISSFLGVFIAVAYSSMPLTILYFGLNYH